MECCSTLCDLGNSANRRFLGQFSVPTEETVDEQLTTPQIVGPIAGSPSWCFVTFASGSGGTAFWTTYNGYVVAGTFAPSSATIDPSVTRQDLGSGPSSSGS